MALQFISSLKSKAQLSKPVKEGKPILTEEDEKFLNHITSQDDGLHDNPLKDLPVAGESTPKDAQLALMDGAQNIPLPETPQEERTESTHERETPVETKKDTKPRRAWSWLRRNSKDARRKNQEETATSLMDAAENIKSAQAQPSKDQVVDDVEAKKEQDDIALALERLNLAAVNNRVFSVSDETQELLQKFNVIFKDLVNGVPTAYDDLESLLTNSDRQLQSTYQSLPSFLQKLVEQLPEKITKGFAPEMMAAAAERAQKSGVNTENAGKAAAAASKLGLKTPSLKDLVGKPGAIASVLRSIIQYLRARFPAFMGMNVLWSLAMFVLLFVLWYCHKRGRDVRLETERALTEEEVARLDAEWKKTRPGEIPTTTAGVGASMEEVKAGMVEAEAARKAAKAAEGKPASSEPSTLGTTVQPAQKVGT